MLLPHHRLQPAITATHLVCHIEYGNHAHTPRVTGHINYPEFHGADRGYPARSSQGEYPAGGYPARGYPAVGYPAWRGVPCQGVPCWRVHCQEGTLLGGYSAWGGYPGRVPPQTRSGWGVPCQGYPTWVPPRQGIPPAGYPPGLVRMGGGTQLGQQKEYSLHGGRYASCVHAGGLSCSRTCFRATASAVIEC